MFGTSGATSIDVPDLRQAAVPENAAKDHPKIRRHGKGCYDQLMSRGGQNPTDATITPTRIAQPSDRSRQLMLEAEEISSELARVGASGVLVFGSVARGTATDTSDLDLLVLWEQSYPIPVLPPEINLPDTDTRWNLLLCKEKILKDPGIRWSLYKQVSTEAVYLHDPGSRFRELLDGLSEATPEFCLKEGRYLQKRLGELRDEDFDDPDECYKWAKAAVMQLNLVEGIPTGEKSEAWKAFGDRYPQMLPAVKTLAAHGLGDASPEQLAESTEALIGFVSEELNSYGCNPRS